MGVLPGFQYADADASYGPRLRKLAATKILIDHHQQPESAVFAYGVSNTEKSSTCEMVYDLIVDSGHADKIDMDIAACLYAGVMTDTGSFRFPGASASVHRMVATLKDTGLNHTQIHENLFDNFLEKPASVYGFCAAEPDGDLLRIQCGADRHSLEGPCQV
jgi:phosphoesterase RecJ-like protein